jgi:ABC-type branched-subunit amino acid transport system ATPase component/branched-subunit amino acid ABC-type transport system permease component/pimeloyl-ACP methyl ester carboxylesterase
LRNFIQFAILGLGIGGIYALLAQGIVLVHRASGVLNLAHGGFAMIGAYVEFELQERHDIPFIIAFPSAIAACAILAAVFHTLVLRRMQQSTAIAKLVVTLALLTILQAAATLRYQGSNYMVSSPLPTRTLDLAGVYVGENQLWLILIAAASTLIIASLARYTLFGLATSAVAENDRAAASLGWSPGQVGLVSWSAAGALAAVAGCLIAPITGLNVEYLAYLVIPALAAALVGGFRSYVVVLFGALAIGVAESELTLYTSMPGLPQAVPFLVIVLILVFRGRPLPSRRDILERMPTLGTGRVRWKTALSLTAGLSLVVYLVSADVAVAITTSMVAALFALSLVVLTGYAGQLSLAQYTFGGVGALVAGRFVADYHIPFLPAVLLGGLAAAAAGLVLSIPSFRTRGTSLTLVTLGIAVAVQDVVFSNSQYTGGVDGTNVGPQRVFGISIDPVRHPWAYGVFCILIFALCAIAVANLRRGRAGRRLIAVRTNERAAASIGVNVMTAKMYAFSLSAGLAGIAGILLAFQGYSLVFNQFDPISGLSIISVAFVGGIGYVIGPLFGGQLAQGGFPGGIISNYLSNFNEWLILAGGIILILFLIQNPNGLAAQNIVAAAAMRRKLFRSLPTASRRAVTYTADAGWVASRNELVVSGLTVRYGTVCAVDDVSLSIRPGEVVALIGPNGAGKTTLVDAVTGFVREDTGEVRLGRHSMKGWSPHRRARAGVVRSFQSLELFDDLTIYENLLSASDRRDMWSGISNLFWVGKQKLSPAAVIAVNQFGLSDDLGSTVKELPYGRRRLVAIARAVAAAPSMLLLDEPAAGLSELESSELGRLIRELADVHGIGILLVEHDMSLVMSISDKIVVLNFGAQIAVGAPGDVRRSPSVVAAYLGSEVTGDGEEGSDSEGRTPSVPVISDQLTVIQGLSAEEERANVDRPCAASRAIFHAGPGSEPCVAARRTCTESCEVGRLMPIDFSDAGRLVELSNHDNEFRYAARFWNATIRVQQDDLAYDAKIVDGLMISFEPAEASEFDVRIAASSSAWSEFLAPIQPAGCTDLRRGRGFQFEGDVVKHTGPYGPALTRLGTLIRLLSSGTLPVAPMEAYPFKDSDIAVGRYAYYMVDDVEYRVYYEQAGDGIPLMLQHTAGADGRQWRHLLADPELQSKFRMFAYDLPYHGRSLPPTNGVSWWEHEYAPTKEHFHKSILGLKRALGLDRPIFMGTSLGGQLAPELIGHYPDDFRAAVAINCWYHMDTLKNSTNQFFHHPRIHPDFYADRNYTVTSPIAPEPFRREISWIYGSGGPALYKGDNDYFIFGHDLRVDGHLIDTSRTPLFVVVGEYDLAASDPNGAEAVARNIPGAKFQVLRGFGHFAMSDDPVRFNRAIGPILDEVVADSHAA